MQCLHRESRCMIENLRRRDQRSDGQAAAQPFSESDNMSGTKPSCWKAMELASPREPDLHLIAHRAGCRVVAQSFPSSAMKPGVGTSMPPSDWMGSMKKAATSCGGTLDANKRSICPGLHRHPAGCRLPDRGRA